MSDQREVTVYDRVPATVAVSVEQVESYLRRTGRWRQLSVRDESISRPSYWSMNGALPSVQIFGGNWPAAAANEIMVIAAHENRQPSAVLADIAKEPM